MPKLPKIPKGLKSQVTYLEKKAARLKEIADLKKKKAELLKKLNGK
jgi:hypothetical protein